MFPSTPDPDAISKHHADKPVQTGSHGRASVGWAQANLNRWTFNSVVCGRKTSSPSSVVVLDVLVFVQMQVFETLLGDCFLYKYFHKCTYLYLNMSYIYLFIYTSVNVINQCVDFILSSAFISLVKLTLFVSRIPGFLDEILFSAKKKVNFHLKTTTLFAKLKFPRINFSFLWKSQC